MKLRIHRGSGQIGGSIVEVAAERTRVVFDCGRNLPPVDDQPAEPEAIEIDGLTRGGNACDALFLTHYHSDHCGLIDRVRAEVPIYASRETRAALSVIADFTGKPQPRIAVIEPGEPILIGDIRVLPLGVRHSARGAMMFLAEADGQKILYTGDFSDFGAFAHESLRGVGVMLCEGTNIGAGTGITEEDVEREAERIMGRTSGAVFVLCSATNLDRIAAIGNACARSGRTAAIDPFQKAVAEQVSPVLTEGATGFVPRYIKAGEPRVHAYLMGYHGFFEGAEKIAEREGLVFFVRPTMGDFLRRLDRRRSLRGSALIYSMWEGYKKTPRIRAFLNLCESLGMEVASLHASGHAYGGTLREAVSLAAPRALVPIHTENAPGFKALHGHVVFLRDGEVFDVGQL